MRWLWRVAFLAAEVLLVFPAILLFFEGIAELFSISPFSIPIQPRALLLIALWSSLLLLQKLIPKPPPRIVYIGILAYLETLSHEERRVRAEYAAVYKAARAYADKYHFILRKRRFHELFPYLRYTGYVIHETDNLDPQRSGYRITRNGTALLRQLKKQTEDE